MCVFVYDRVDSMMLVSEGFNVVSTDASDKMLKYALKERWNRRKDPAFDQWGIPLPLPLPWDVFSSINWLFVVCPGYNNNNNNYHYFYYYLVYTRYSLLVPVMAKHYV